MDSNINITVDIFQVGTTSFFNATCGLNFHINYFMFIFVEIGKWQHICFLWSSVTSSGKIYVEGTKLESTVTVRDAEGKGKWPIPGKGIAIIGQDQDTLGGAFQTEESYEGEIFDLQIWDKELEEDKIYQLAGCDDTIFGNVYSWLSTSALIRGGLVLSPTTVCTL